MMGKLDGGKESAQAKLYLDEKDGFTNKCYGFEVFYIKVENQGNMAHEDAKIMQFFGENHPDDNDTCDPIDKLTMVKMVMAMMEAMMTATMTTKPMCATTMAATMAMNPM